MHTDTHTHKLHWHCAHSKTDWCVLEHTTSLYGSIWLVCEMRSDCIFETHKARERERERASRETNDGDTEYTSEWMIMGFGNWCSFCVCLCIERQIAKMCSLAPTHHTRLSFRSSLNRSLTHTGTLQCASMQGTFLFNYIYIGQPCKAKLTTCNIMRINSIFTNEKKTSHRKTFDGKTPQITHFHIIFLVVVAICDLSASFLNNNQKEFRKLYDWNLTH